MEERPKAREFAGPGRKPKKLVHNLIFSMPPGTDPQKVLQAVRQLAKEEWILKHRFAMVLHTDEPHPHVHVVIKARNEKGKRLNIRKSTLRGWRQQFAQNLRELGVAANATERTARGVTRTTMPDGMYRAVQRGEMIRVQRVATKYNEMRANAMAQREPQTLPRNKSQQIIDGWWNLYDSLREHGQDDLARSVRAFARQIKAQQEKDQASAQARQPLTPERER